MGTKKRSIIRAVKNLFFLVPSLLNLAVNLSRLIGFEARMAGKNLQKVIMLVVFMGLLLTSTWLCVLAILFVLLITHFSFLVSLSILFSINVFCLLLVVLVIVRAKNNLFFPETRHQIHSLVRRWED